MRSHVITADAGFVYVVRTVYRNLVKQTASIIDCRVIIRHAAEGARISLIRLKSLLMAIAS